MPSNCADARSIASNKKLLNERIRKKDYCLADP